MKWILRSSIFIIFLSFIPFLHAETSNGNYLVDLVVGTVEISHDSGTNWSDLAVDTVINESDSIRTGQDSYCEIGFPSEGGSFRVVENSLLLVKKLGPQSQFQTKKGKAFFDIEKKLSSDESFQVESDTVIAAVRGTQFVSENSDDSSSLYVLKGNVSVERNLNLDDETSKAVKEDLTVSAGENQEISFTKKENQTLRDRVIERRSNRAALREYLHQERAANMKKMVKIRNKAYFQTLLTRHQRERALVKAKRKAKFGRNKENRKGIIEKRREQERTQKENLD